jgi:DNA-binding transcriptional LysR family regulator
MIPPVGAKGRHLYSRRVDVELRQLRAVVAVAEERSFTAAAQRLHLSQQSVSALVRRLERNLDVRLFDRTTRRVTPTPACEDLLPALTSALELLDGALARARRGGPRERPLRIALTPSVIFGTLQDLLEVVAETGLAEPEVRDVWADELPAAVRDGRFDAGLAVEIDPDPGLAVEPWRRQRVDLLVAETHPFAARGEVTVEQLRGTTLVIPERTAHVGWHARLADTLARAEVRPTIAEAPRVAGPAPAAVVRGEAVTVWLSGMDDRYVPHGLVRVPLRAPETMVTTQLVIRTAPDPAVRASLDVLRHAIEVTRSL